MKIAIWILLVQATLGATDTLYYHEYKLKLPHGDHTKTELKLHAVRDFCYAIIIASLGFVTWQGTLAWLLLAILAAEIVITLWDFVEEDKVRKLPAGERCMHAIMGIVYGAFLAYLLPELFKWSNLPTGWGQSYHGFPAWMLLLIATGVGLSGIRDLIASVRPHKPS
jgi:phosphatidylglycerophosphate synthase